jgi:hypothetical protein
VVERGEPEAGEGGHPPTSSETHASGVLCGTARRATARAERPLPGAARGFSARRPAQRRRV